MNQYTLTPAQRDTIIAALRLWEKTPASQINQDITNIATNGDEHGLLTFPEIDALCESLNMDGQPLPAAPCITVFVTGGNVNDVQINGRAHVEVWDYDNGKAGILNDEGNPEDCVQDESGAWHTVDEYDGPTDAYEGRGAPPAGRFLSTEDAALVEDALGRAEGFLSGFEGDETQETVTEDLEAIRDAQSVMGDLPERPKTFTVIGLYEDTGQVFCGSESAADPHTAISACAREHRGGPTLQFLGAIEGDHQMVTACEDSGKAAYSSDLLPEVANG